MAYLNILLILELKNEVSKANLNTKNNEIMSIADIRHARYRLFCTSRGPFLERPGNLPGPISVFGEKSYLTEVNFC